MTTTTRTLKIPLPTREVDTTVLFELRLRNFLSFGPDADRISLGPLNIFIGPNGSGKSNLIEAISFLRSAPKDIENVVRAGGGVEEWIWKGDSEESTVVSAVFVQPDIELLLQHTISFSVANQAMKIDREAVSEVEIDEDAVVNRYYSFTGGTPQVWRGKRRYSIPERNFDPRQSIIAQRQDPERYPYLSTLANLYSSIRIYREWTLGRNTIFRVPQRADMRSDRLEEDFSNLGLFLNRLRRDPSAKKKVLKHLHDIYDEFDDFDISIEGGTVQVFFNEGAFNIPATRLSDGTLRYLCLLAILCDPNPPPLICLEEPEIGLHPDILPKIADLIAEASTRTQLIMTTHSDIIIDSMTDRPEAVQIVEKRDGQTTITRLSADKSDERLGVRWMSGELGGTRW